MKRLVVDLGCGTWCRGDIGIDVQFWHREPTDQPWKFDPILGGRNPLCTRVMANLDYSIPLRSCTADVVIMRAVLEHLSCPLYTLREVYRILKPGGVAKIVVPNARVSLADWRDMTHIYSWTEASLEHLLSRVFDRVEIRKLFGNESLYAEAWKLADNCHDTRSTPLSDNSRLQGRLQEG